MLGLEILSRDPFGRKNRKQKPMSERVVLMDYGEDTTSSSISTKVSHQTCRWGIDASVVGDEGPDAEARMVFGVGGSSIGLAGLASPSSGSMTPNAASVVSIPSAVPLRAPAAGTKSIGRGFTPDRTRLFDVSSL